MGEVRGWGRCVGAHTKAHTRAPSTRTPTPAVRTPRDLWKADGLALAKVLTTDLSRLGFVPSNASCAINASTDARASGTSADAWKQKCPRVALLRARELVRTRFTPPRDHDRT